jgi:hypothetical protein
MLTRLSVLALALAAGTALADEYQLIPVPAFPGIGIPECYLRDIDNHNIAVGTSTVTTQDAQGNYHGGYTGITWTESAGKAVIDNNSYPTGISDTGWVSGLGAVTHLPTGQVYHPPTLPGTFGAASLLGINDAGTAVGFIQTCICSNSQHLQQVPYIWDAANGARTISLANAKELVKINNSGIAVGNTRASGGVGDGFVYDSNTGATILLSSVLPPPPPGVVYTIVAADINDSGTVTGYIRENTTAHNIGFTWSASSGTTLMSPPIGAGYGEDVRPASINSSGVVVGTIGFSPGGSRPFIYDAARGVRDLATLTTPTITFSYWYASSVNNAGWITAYGASGSGFAAAILKPAAPVCYANCDQSSAAPVLNANDFQCFLNQFAAGEASANCDQSTTAPTLNANDFQCFLNAFAAGCA